MNIILLIVMKELRQILRDKRLRFMAIAAPVIQLTVLGYAAVTDVKHVPLVVCDYDRTSISRGLVDRFLNSTYFELAGTVDTADGVDEYIEHGRAALALVIPADFSANVLGRHTAQLQVIADGTDGNSANIALAYASMIVNSYSQYLLQDMLDKNPQADMPPRIAPEIRVWHNASLQSRNYMVPGVLAFVLMLITMSMTSMAIVREREIGTMEQLLVTPIRPWQLLFGKLIPYVIIGMIDVTLVLLVAVFWFHVPLRGSVGLLYLCSGLFVLTMLGLGLFVSTVARTQQQALMIAQFAFFIPFMYFSGFVFPIENMPVVIQKITYLVPLRYFMEIIRGIFLKGVGMDVLWPQMLALVAIGVSVFSLAVLRFRRTIE